MHKFPLFIIAGASGVGMTTVMKDIRWKSESFMFRILVRLFYETVHSVNKKDYTQEQLDAWASKNDEQLRMKSWKDSMSNNITYVALIDGIIVGFSDMTPKGYLDRLYVHKDFQGRGIASSLVNVLESEASKLGLTELNTDASITAKSFFEHHGYQFVQS